MRANGHGLVGNIIAAGLNAVGNLMLSGAKGAGRVGLAAADAAGKGIVKTGKVAGQVGLGAATMAGRVAVGTGKALAQGTKSTNGFKNPIGAIVRKADDIGQGMASWERTTVTRDPYSGELKTKLGGLKFNKKGMAALVGVGALGSAFEAKDSMDARMMGKISPGVVTNTPTVDSRPWREQYRQGTYLNNGGADGSLVFAMHQNRHG